MTTDLQAISLPFDEAIAFFRQKTNIPTERWTDVWREAHDRGFMVAGAATDALLNDFKAAIDKALAQGTTLEEFRKDFDAIVKKHGWQHTGSAGWRSRVIYETNLAGAYAAGRFKQMTDPDVKSAYPFWQYVHGNSQHPRVQHLAWDGLTLSCDDPFWEAHYPPNGWRCSCYVRPLSRAALGRMGKDGPDTAPPTVLRPWVDKNTGQIHQVPVGIDPGFDYTPGRKWVEAPVKSPELRPAGGAADPEATRIDPATVLAASERLTKLQQTWADTLTPTENQALSDYKAGGGRSINQALRGEIDYAEALRTGRRLQGALSRATAPDDLVVLRGAGKEEVAALRQLGRDGVYVPDGFVSTSLTEQFPAYLAETEGAQIVEIIVRKGTPGVAYIHPFPKYRFRQYELLINAASRLRVLRADDQIIRLEVLNDEAGQ